MIKHSVINAFTSSLPGDPVTNNYVRTVLNSCFSFVNPTKVPSPQIISVNEELSKELGINYWENKEFFKNIFSGNKIFDGFKPYAQNYGGHQFGNWAGQLGDGRAITVMELKLPNSDKFELQLKGSGQTPYSRFADGKAVLRSSLREYLCSEAMHHLNIPTTRALSLMLSGENIVRDMFYDGNPKEEKGAIVCRVSPSFLRFGHFEIHARNNDTLLLKKLVQYALENHFKHLIKKDIKFEEQLILCFEEIVKKTAFLVAEWMRVGFVHGVLNTDNMSILGLTIDYGPYGWIDDFNLNWTPNTTDLEFKRYRFGEQPNIAMWNLFKLAESLSVINDNFSEFEKIIDCFPKYFEDFHNSNMSKKLGLQDLSKNSTFYQTTYNLLQNLNLDMTLFFRFLTKNPLNSLTDIKLVKLSYLDNFGAEHFSLFNNWKNKYQKLVNDQNIDEVKRKKIMEKNNPNFILRNYITQEVINELENGNNKRLKEVEEIIKNPYSNNIQSKYITKRPDWAKNKAGCSMLSCSS